MSNPVSPSASALLGKLIGQRIKNITWSMTWTGYQMFVVETYEGNVVEVFENSQAGQAVMQLNGDYVEPDEQGISNE